jgi:hypothetical protein
MALKLAPLVIDATVGVLQLADEITSRLDDSSGKKKRKKKR